MSNLKLFESKHIRSIWNEEEQKWYFSLQDVVLILTNSLDIKQYIKKMLSRDEQLKWKLLMVRNEKYKPLIQRAY